MAVYVILFCLFGPPVLMIILGPSMARAEARKKAEYKDAVDTLKSSASWDALFFFHAKFSDGNMPSGVCGVSSSEQKITFGDVRKPALLSTSEILSWSPILEGDARVSANASAISVRGVGLSSGRVKAQRLVKNVALKLVVNHTSRPIVVVKFFSAPGSGAPANSRRIRTAVDQLERIQALLLIAQRRSVLRA